MLSPYQLNPMNYNPLRDVLEQSVDFERLRARLRRSSCSSRPPTCAPARSRSSSNDEITADAVLASACLPFLFQAVEIDGEHYWDGGYMGNPAIFPLIYDCESRDVRDRPHQPDRARRRCRRTATEIMNRINEISFNSSLMREMRAIAFVTKLIDDGPVDDRHAQADADPRHRGRRGDAGAVGDEQAQRRLGVPDPPARRRPRGREPVARRELRADRRRLDRRRAAALPERRPHRLAIEILRRPHPAGDRNPAAAAPGWR